MSENRADEWLTDEIRALLAAIRGPHVDKKRTTVLLIAFARANAEPIKPIFEREDTCAESVWWGKWSRQPDIRAALEACEARALEWADRETVRIEARHRQERRRALAKWAAAAPDALGAVMGGGGQRGSDRINAAVTLIRLADPETAAGVQPTAVLEQSQMVVIDDAREQLARLLGAEPATGEAAGSAGGVEQPAGAGAAV